MLGWPDDDGRLLSHSANDERIAEIEALFTARGWHLRSREENGAWEAWFYIAGIDSALPATVVAASRLEAAEAALALYEQRP
jgi:hypothetical protein